MFGILSLFKSKKVNPEPRSPLQSPRPPTVHYDTPLTTIYGQFVSKPIDIQEHKNYP